MQGWVFCFARASHAKRSILTEIVRFPILVLFIFSAALSASSLVAYLTVPNPLQHAIVGWHCSRCILQHASFHGRVHALCKPLQHWHSIKYDATGGTVQKCAQRVLARTSGVTTEIGLPVVLMLLNVLRRMCNSYTQADRCHRRYILLEARCKLRCLKTVLT